MPYSSKYYELPESIQNVINLSTELIEPEQVILFGSRARGDFGESSDYDIAFKQIRNPGNWSRFLAEVESEPITLLKIDLLLYEEASDDYKKNIDKEGVLLFEP